MSEDSTSIQVHFGRALPLFPLDTTTLLPQQVIPLHIFEPRYVQMVEHALDGAGQVAMAVFMGRAWKQQYHGRPPVRPAVCVGQIVQHQKLPDGLYNIVLQGVCRARIVRELAPEEGRLYRLAMLEPVGLKPGDTGRLAGVRGEVAEMLSEGPLEHLANAEVLLRHLGNEEIPTPVLLEVLAFTLINNDETRYRLLAEPDPVVRGEVVRDELRDLGKLIDRALKQKPDEWPKGCSWN